MSTRSELSVIASTSQLLTLVVTVGALYFARDVFIPMALAILLSFLLSPLVNRLQRCGISNTLSVITTAFIAFVIMGGGLTLLGRELSKLVGELPQYKEELVGKARSIAGIRSGMTTSLDDLAEEMSNAMEVGAEEADDLDASNGEALEEGLDDGTVQPTEDTANDQSTGWGQAAAVTDSGNEPSNAITSPVLRLRKFTDNWLSRFEGQEESREHDGKTPKTPLYTTDVAEGIPFLTWASTAGTVLGPLGTAGLVTVFVLFILVHRHDLRDRIIAVISHGNYVMTTEALTEVAKRISRYLIAQTIVNTTYGVILSIGLFIIGRTLAPEGTFPNLILWGVLAACFRFVPYAGPIIGAVFPLAFSLTVFPGFAVFGSVLGLIIIMELLSNNIFEPWLYGASTGISAVAVIMAAVFWGWLWGPVGLLLSTPLTVCLVVLGRHVPRFKIFSTLLGEEISIKPSLRFYQRLLARDVHQATQMLTLFREEKGTIDTCDNVIIPTIKRLRSDRKHGELNAADSVELLEVMQQCVHSIDWQEQTEQAKPSSKTDDDGLSENEEDGESDHALDSRATVETVLPLTVAMPAHHFSDDILLKLLHDSLGHTTNFDIVDDSELPDQTARHIAERSPALVIIALVPPGGFAQVRALCRAFRDHGYDGPILVSCIGNFKHSDRLAIKFRNSGATHVTTTFKQTHFKARLLVARHQPVAPVGAEL